MGAIYSGGFTDPQTKTLWPFRGEVVAPAVIRLISALGNDLAKSPRLTPTSTPPPNRPSPMAPSHQSLKPKAQVSLQSSLLRSPLSTRQQEAQRLFWCPPHLTHPLHMASPWPPPATSVVFLILTAPSVHPEAALEEMCRARCTHGCAHAHPPHITCARTRACRHLCRHTSTHAYTRVQTPSPACMHHRVCVHPRTDASTHTQNTPPPPGNCPGPACHQIPLPR